LTDDERAEKTCELIAKFAIPWKLLEPAIIRHAEGPGVQQIREQTKKQIKKGLCGQMQDRAKDPFGEGGK
jgi:hypothetical protein